ncbi:MAG: phosphate ABC transporter permease subunit PstC [Fusobacteriaceae bacterium]
MNKTRKYIDMIFKYIHSFVGIFNIIIVILIFAFIFLNSINFFRDYPIRKFMFGNEWISLSGKFGLLPLLVGTFWITFIALIIAVPFGIMTSLYINEYATKKVRKYLKISVETMSAIPSVVLGFIGLSVFSIPIKNLFGLNTGLTALTGGIMLAFMAIPTIVSFSDDALESLDKSYKEASFALGANRLETLIKILIPAAFPGIFAGIMLGFGRIVGETMAVLMITGNSPIMAKNPLSPVRALTATIASEMGEVVQGSTHYYALFAIGLVLFIISFATTSIADIYVRKSRKLMGK